jgi:hypothetical protein
MSERPTPETDALAVVCYGESGIDNSYGFRAVPIDDCRQLERERDEAREQIAELLRCHHDEPCTAVVLQQDAEIKQLREELKGWELKWKCAVEMAALAQVKLDKVKEAAK